MMKMREFALAVTLTALMAGCGQTTTKAEALAPTSENATQVITDAEAARKKAASVQGEWRDTADIIKKAQEAAKKGEFASAIKLATMAREQGELGYQQAVSQQELHMPAYLKY